MKFILYSLNYTPEISGIGKYNGELCPALVEAGFGVTAIVAQPYYPEWRIPQEYKRLSIVKSQEEGVEVLRCPLYVPRKVDTLRRLIHLTSFAFSSLVGLGRKIFSRPDLVFLVQPTLFCAPGALLFAKLTGAKAIMHIQDYEIDAMFGLNLFESKGCMKWALKVERFLLRRFDAVSTISYTMMQKAQQKGVDQSKIIFFPNWSDTDFVHPGVSGDDLRAQWGYGLHDKILLYSGNVGKKQGLELILDAAACLQSQPDVKFLIVGEGAHLEALKDYACQLQLTNLDFKPLQAWSLVPQLLAMADIHLVVQSKGAADSVLPSKLTNILAAGGHAIITAEVETELGALSKDFLGIFKRVAPEDVDAFVAGIQEMLSTDLSHHNQIARDYAERYLTKKSVIARFVKDALRIAS